MKMYAASNIDDMSHNKMVALVPSKMRRIFSLAYTVSGITTTKKVIPAAMNKQKAKPNIGASIDRLIRTARLCEMVECVHKNIAFGSI
jgi:hypothetical protein